MSDAARSDAPLPDVRAALFDIDGTLTSGGRPWIELVGSSEVGKLHKAWLYLTGMPHYGLSRIGVADPAAFRDRWVRLMAGLMIGWREDEVQAMCKRIVERSLVPVLRSDVVQRLEAHKAQGHTVVLVSTMFEAITQTLALHGGADRGLGSVVAIRDGACAGKIVGQTCSGPRKLSFAQTYLATVLPGVTLDQCAAYADSASDIPFLSGVGHPAAVYPDDRMRAVAEENGWPIIGV